MTSQSSILGIKSTDQQFYIRCLLSRNLPKVIIQNMERNKITYWKTKSWVLSKVPRTDILVGQLVGTVAEYWLCWACVGVHWGSSHSAKNYIMKVQLEVKDLEHTCWYPCSDWFPTIPLAWLTTVTVCRSSGRETLTPCGRSWPSETGGRLTLTVWGWFPSPASSWT